MTVLNGWFNVSLDGETNELIRTDWGTQDSGYQSSGIKIVGNNVGIITRHEPYFDNDDGSEHDGFFSYFGQSEFYLGDPYWDYYYQDGSGTSMINGKRNANEYGDFNGIAFYYFEYKPPTSSGRSSSVSENMYIGRIGKIIKVIDPPVYAS